MFKIFYNNSDATMYEALPDMNTGLDEILEIGKRINTSGSYAFKSRSLIKFDMTEVSSSLSKYSVSVNNCKFVLQLFASDVKNLASNVTVDCLMSAQPWTNGTGYVTDVLVTDGVSWTRPHASWSLDSTVGEMWISSSQNIQLTGSAISVLGSGSGGSWYSGSLFQQSYDVNSRTVDINLDVTNAVKLWISGSNGYHVPNNGFLLKFSSEYESDTAVAGYINYFSRETNTIYVPRLLMYWDNSTYTTGSLAAVNTESFIAYTSIKPAYKDTEVAKIRIYSRDKYPQKSPTNLFPQQVVKRLPATTYYTVIDAVTDEVIIPYDDIYTKVSCDSTSNFIHIDFNGFMPERNYRLEFKIVDGIEEQYTTDQIYFKVIR